MLQGLLVLFFAQFAGSGILPISTKIGVQFIDPLIFVFLRFFLASIIFFPFFFFTKKQKLSTTEYKKVMILSFFLFTNVTLFTIGIQFTTAIMSQILYTATPIVVGLLGNWFFGERLTKNKLIGLAIAFSGVAFLLFQSVAKQEHITFGTPIGNILILIAMLGYSGYLLYARTLANSKKYTSVQLSFYTFLFIGIYLFAINIFSSLFTPISLHSVPSIALWSVIAVSIGNVLSYAFLQLGIKMTSAFTASLFQYLGPFLSGIIAIPLLHEKPTIELIIGGFLIIAGVFYATTFPYVKRFLQHL